MTLDDLLAVERVAELCSAGVTRMIRERHGWSLRQTGDACEPPLSAATILRYERGDRTPKGPKGLGYARVIERAIES
jgi:hypothetical protein